MKAITNIAIICVCTYLCAHSTSVVPRCPRPIVHFSVKGDPPGFVSLQLGTNICFYISTTKIWPYANATTWLNTAATVCSKMDLTMATIKNAQEYQALKNLTSKLLTYLSSNRLCVERYNLNPYSKPRNFQTFKEALSKFTRH